MKTLFRISFLLIAIVTSCIASAQVVIKVEKLSKPKELLPVQEVLPRWCSGKTLFVNVDADSLVYFEKQNPFFYGMYEAYANHRPFVLSPDMIWLLISQGFSHHINANPERYRNRIVDFSDKMSLVVESDRPLDSAQWDLLIPEFAENIKKNTKGTIAETIIADFTTTTSNEQIASEITLMETMKPYFEFVVMYSVCGIPEITLLGTTEDWQKVYDKAMRLRSYDLAWWIDELKPILEQFIKASQGDIDVKFWRNMFKWHTQEEYGAPNIVDGWIVKFYPYDKDGKRFDLKTLTRNSNLPDEKAEADVFFIKIDKDGLSTETVIELYGGFIGLEQNPENFALTPKIGWMVKKKIDEDSVNLARMNRQIREMGGFELNVKDVPEVLNKIDSIPGLILYFRDGVYFPEWMKYKKIGFLRVYGTITVEERNKILRWYSNIIINNVSYHREEGTLNINIDGDNNTALYLLGIDSIGTLYINNDEKIGFNYTGKILDVNIPKGVTKRIDKIILNIEPSLKCKKALRRQFPKTEILWNIDRDDYL